MVIFFILFLFLTTFGLMNIVVGVIVENTLAVRGMTRILFRRAERALLSWPWRSAETAPTTRQHTMAHLNDASTALETSDGRDFQSAGTTSEGCGGRCSLRWPRLGVKSVTSFELQHTCGNVERWLAKSVRASHLDFREAASRTLQNSRSSHMFEYVIEPIVYFSGVSAWSTAQNT